MTQSDTEAWFVGPQGGSPTCLNQYCWSVSTFGVGRTLPVMRGNNIQVAYIPGQIYRKKYPDSRVISLTMWTAAIDPATDQPVPENQRLQFSNNMRTLQTLFYNVAGNQFELTRQWYYNLPVNTGIPSGAPTIVQATALAEIAGDMAPTMFSPMAASFTVDCLLADPYFYGPPVVASIAYNTPATVVNTGDDVAAYNNNTVTLYGPLQYPRVTNSTTNPTTWLQLNTVILAGDAVTVDIANSTAYRASDGANLSGSIAHSGTKRWMSYNPGVNIVTLTSSNSSDTGSATLSFVPPYV